MKRIAQLKLSEVTTLRVDYPYGLYREGDKYCEVNREYSNLYNPARGEKSKDSFFTLTEDQISTLKALCGSNGENGFFLYKDGNTPWSSRANYNTYMKKLEKWREVLN